MIYEILYRVAGKAYIKQEWYATDEVAVRHAFVECRQGEIDPTWVIVKRGKRTIWES